MVNQLIWVVLAVSLTSCGSNAVKVGLPMGHRYETYYSRNQSMLPTIRPSADELFVDERSYDAAGPARGDIIVFTPPMDANGPIVKRVIALPGDKLDIRGGVIKVNDRVVLPKSPLMRPKYTVSVNSFRLVVDGVAFKPPVFDVPPRAYWTSANRLPRGCYFVLGDNVSQSKDSHVWGCTELRGTFSSGPRMGEQTLLVGKVVKIVSIPKIRSSFVRSP